MAERTIDFAKAVERLVGLFEENQKTVLALSQEVTSLKEQSMQGVELPPLDVSSFDDRFRHLESTFLQQTQALQQQNSELKKTMEVLGQKVLDNRLLQVTTGAPEAKQVAPKRPIPEVPQAAMWPPRAAISVPRYASYTLGQED